MLSELLFTLGKGESIVGVDATSVYPVQVEDLPNLGHVTQLNAEAILALRPDLIFLEESQLGQAEALNQLQGAGVKIVPVPTRPVLGNALRAAETMRDHLDIEPVAIEELREKVHSDSLLLAEALADLSDRPRVLFIYARGAGRLLVGGADTPASAIIEQAGGVNSISSFTGYRALSPESLIESAPDVILMSKSGLASLNGKEGLARITGISQTPAFQNDRIVTMDGHLLTAFGPRAGKAALELAQKIHTF
jgi:iron complex transport system substrate-binding protein